MVHRGRYVYGVYYDGNDRLLTASNQKTTLQVLANIIITNNCTLKIWNIQKTTIETMHNVFFFAKNVCTHIYILLKGFLYSWINRKAFELLLCLWSFLRWIYVQISHDIASERFSVDNITDWRLIIATFSLVIVAKWQWLIIKKRKLLLAGGVMSVWNIHFLFVNSVFFFISSIKCLVHNKHLSLEWLLSWF